MQFKKDGPDIPERLLEAHEDGKVVFFCGAGISYPAGLPDFKTLVEQIYDGLGEQRSSVEEAAFSRGQYDTVVGLLEGRLIGGRSAVRKELARILTPDPLVPGSTETHRALLTLGRDRQGSYRLITTNFDRLFERARVEAKLDVATYQAPFLPVPKSRWNGLVYLHGLLAELPREVDLGALVVSSGDFGLAYLAERWAARFVSELFRGYTVCFVGYSIHDPVLRYMMDALAADKLLGESPPEMFAFGGHAADKGPHGADEWSAKNVTPILYDPHGGHSSLHESLREWAITYRDGALGKERLVLQNLSAKPLASTTDDNFVGRMLWALSDRSGIPAQRFAEAT